MNVSLRSLTIQFRKAREILDLSAQISFFHGEISSGKSSIARIIDFCLGGKLNPTSALKQEFVSAQLEALIGLYVVLLDRQESAPVVRVAFYPQGDSSGKNITTLLVPLVAGDAPIAEPQLFNLSDVLFYLCGVKPIKVRKSKKDTESDLVRLSFRDLIWYCYLEQDHLDSSFYNLDDDGKKYKSRDVMRFVLGYYSERMAAIEGELERLSEDRKAKEQSIEEIGKFLLKFGYESGLQILTEIDEAKKRLDAAKAELETLRATHKPDAHLVERLRNRLRDMSKRLGRELDTLRDLKTRNEEQGEFRAELQAAKFKLSKIGAASAVLSGVTFDHCPSCGTDLSLIPRPAGSCQVCAADSALQERTRAERAEVMNRDLDAQIDDLDIALRTEAEQFLLQQQRVDALHSEKVLLDARLTDEMKQYDSAFLSMSREAERAIATQEEKIRGLTNIGKMIASLDALEAEVTSLRKMEQNLRADLLKERQRLSGATTFIGELESTYLSLLLEVGVPGVRPSDRVEINLTTWIPNILPGGNVQLSYNFYDGAGSGGKKTLLNVCYGLAFHTVAAANDLPLPTFLIIDTPMKNIDPEVNKDIFLSLYKALYRLASQTLKETQFIIIDNEFAKDTTGAVSISERLMTPNQPLIPYYRGA